MLYGDWYDGATFDYRLTLPPAGDERCFSLAWAESVQIEPAGEGRWQVRSLAGGGELDNAALRWLARSRAPQPVDALLDELGDWPGLRPLINQLLAARVLWLRPAASRGRGRSSRRLCDPRM